MNEKELKIPYKKFDVANFTKEELHINCLKLWHKIVTEHITKFKAFQSLWPDYLYIECFYCTKAFIDKNRTIQRLSNDSSAKCNYCVFKKHLDCTCFETPFNTYFYETCNTQDPDIIWMRDAAKQFYYVLEQLAELDGVSIPDSLKLSKKER